MERIKNLTGLNAAGAKENDSPFLKNTQFAGGASLAFIPVKYPISQKNVFEALPPFYNGFTLSGNYIFWHQDDFISLAGNTGLTFAFSASQNFGVSMLAQVPAYALFRLGAGATPFNENRVGFGVGLGLNYAYTKFPLSSDGFTKNGEGNAHIFAPAAMAELTFNLNGSPLSIRGQLNLMQRRGKLNDVGYVTQGGNFVTEDIAVDYSFFSLGLIWYFY